ncbi:HIR3 [Candida theae]|uniref:HIR3 n=1 Tax=Candida theae TaxID=1198502 RepID=A0AAD5G1H6_9ASCO|nr:HIR3 [Candida theae]KAI5968926.1 HIR3 [Candida theae]
MHNAVAENVLGTIGTILWCVQLVPQIIRNFRAKNCQGLPALMMFLWAASGVPFSIYFVAIDGSIPLRIQPQLFTFFCFVSWIQVLYYPPVQMPRKKLVLLAAAFLLVSVGLEVGFILWLRPLHRRGITWPTLIIGIIATVLIAIGLIPPYFELAKRKGRVIGINFVFLTMDSLGAIFSMLSIIVGKFDVLSCVLYAVVIALELGIFSSHVIWWLRFGKDAPSESELVRMEREEKEGPASDEVKEGTQIDTESSDSERMSTFKPLNILEDATSKKDLEEEHTRELQFEQAFKLFQQALKLQKQRDYNQAYELYDQIFQIDIISNHYYEEVDYVRGVQNGLVSDVSDVLSTLSPNLKSLRYLIFRNRGFLFMDILKQESLIDQLNGDNENREEKFKKMFYSMLDDFCIALYYNEADEKLLDVLHGLWIYLNELKLAKSTMEYAVSSKSESDDISGLLPIEKSDEARLQNINAKLAAGMSSDLISEALCSRFKFLEPMKRDIAAQQLRQSKKNKLNVRLTSKNDSLMWEDVMDALNDAVRNLQDESKVEDVNRPKLRFTEPYILTEEPLEIVSFETHVEETAETVKEVEPSGDNETSDSTENKPVGADNTTEAEDKSDEQQQTESQENKQQNHRASKRLARAESVSDKPEVVVAKEHFTGMEYFLSQLNSFASSLNVNDVIGVYLENAQSPRYLKDFVTIINNWKPNFTAAFSSFNSVKSNGADANAKLLEMLNKFSGNIQGDPSSEYVSSIPSLDSEVLTQLTERQPDYLTLKADVIKFLLGSHQNPIILEFRWGQSMVSKFVEWIIQFEHYLFSSIGESLEDARTAVGVLEILVDQSISLESQIRRSINSKRFNKAVTNGLCSELLKYNDKITKWSSITNAAISSLDGSEHDKVFLRARLKWCNILKQKSQTAAGETNKVNKASLEDLLHFLTAFGSAVRVSYPNYKNFPDLNLDAVKSQLTIISVLAVFWRILFSNKTGGNSEAVMLLEDILLDSERKTNEVIQSIKSFMSNGNVDMKLSLWSILLQFYKSSKTTSKLMLGFEKSLKEFNNYLTSDEYTKLPDSVRLTTLCKVMGFYNNNLGYVVQSLEYSGWRLCESMEPSPLVSLLELCLLFEVHEEACSITSLRTSIKESSPQSYESLKDMLLKTVVAIMAIMERDYPQATLHNAIKLLHAQLGASGICDAGDGIFLKASQEYLCKLEDSEKDISQLIKCKYNYNIGIEGFVPLDHGTQVKEELTEEDCEELVKFVLPLCFRENTIKNVPKHDMKVIIEEMHEVIGDPDYESDDTLSRNKAVIEDFLDTTSITPKFVRDTFHGLMTLEHGDAKSKLGSSGLYYLQGLLIFSSYKLRKKNMQGRAVEIENAITLFKNDLICGGNRMESWFLMGQAYGYLVEDDLIWTSDKLTVIDRKIGTANLQRKALICYLMAINCTLDKSARDRIKPIVGSLMSLFARELFGAVSAPMDMLALQVQSKPQFVQKPTGAIFSNVAEKPSLSMQFCLRLIKQSLHLAIRTADAEWTDFYYLSKSQRKLGDSAIHVLDTMAHSCAMVSKTRQSECILEPYYSLVVLCMKYVKSDNISPVQGLEYLRKVPLLQHDVSEVQTKKQFYDVILSSLKQIDAADKKNWQHRAKYRLARILYDEYDDVEEASKIMSSFISLKSPNKQLVSIWKPEAERPGKHFLYTYQYIRFYIDLLRQKKDLNSLIIMIPKLRRSSSIMVNLYSAWEFLCSTICKMMRGALGVGESFSYTDHFINNLSYSVFSANVKSMFESLEHKGIPSDLVPDLCFLHGANDMRKSNNGYGPTSMIDDTLVTIFFKMYTYFNPNTDFFSTFTSPGVKKKIAKKDIFPLTVDLLKLCKKEIDTKLGEANGGYNYALNELSTQKQEKLKKEAIVLDSSEEPEAKLEQHGQNSAAPISESHQPVTPSKLGEHAANTTANVSQTTQANQSDVSSFDDSMQRYLVETGTLHQNGIKVHPHDNDPQANAKGSEDVKPEVNEGSKRARISGFNPLNRDVINIDSDEDPRTEERPAKRSK